MLKSEWKLRKNLQNVVVKTDELIEFLRRMEGLTEGVDETNMN